VLLVLVGQAWAQPVAPAKPAHPDQVSVTAQRLAILDFEYDPDEGNLVVRGTDVDGVKPYALDALSIAAIGDEIERGRTIRAELAQVNASTFRGTLNLSEGTWNLVVRANQGEQRLEGQYQLGVGKSVVTGRVPLVPPNPEVGRLTWIVGLMFGVPLGIALVLVVGIVVVRQLRGAPRASA
jgi:hypothetical protein